MNILIIILNVYSQLYHKVNIYYETVIFACILNRERTSRITQINSNTVYLINECTPYQ